MNYDEKKYGWIWKRVSRHGYCFTYRIPCRILGSTGKRIKIAALLVDGSERNHTIERANLEHNPCQCFGECRGLELALNNLPGGR